LSEFLVEDGALMISAFATTASTIVPRNPQSVGCEVQLHLPRTAAGALSG
jgi:hypothetical protein